MGQMDNSPIPAHAITCWVGEKDIFVALPMTAGGIPYIMRFALSEGGLSEALKVLKKQQRESILPTAAAPANYTIPAAQPMVKTSKAQERLHAETTEAQRENARKLVAKLGIK